MHDFEPEPAAPKRSRAFTIWALCTAVLAGPSVLVWLVRATGYALQCVPGPGLCHGIALGGGLRDTLDLAWFAGTGTLFALGLAFVAAIAALIARRPLLAGLSLLILPIIGLVLPTLAVFFSSYDGCEVNEAGIGSCALWGAHMGMAFHTAAIAPWLIYAIVPYSFALALMVGVIGFLFFRRRAPGREHHDTIADTKRFADQ